MEKQKRRPRSSKSDSSEYWRKAESSSSGGRRPLLRSSAAVKTPDDSVNPSRSRDTRENRSPEVAIVVNDNNSDNRGATKDSKSRRQVAEEEAGSRDKATGNVGRGGGGEEEEAGSRDGAGSRGSRRCVPRPYFEPMRCAYWLDEYRMEDDYYMHCLAKIYDVTPMKRQKERQYWNILQHLGGHRHHSCLQLQWSGYERYLSRPRTTEHRRVNPSESSQRNQRSRSTMTSAADGKRAKPTTEAEEEEEDDEEDRRRMNKTSPSDYTSSAETQQQQQQRSPRSRTRRQSREDEEDRDRDDDRDGVRNEEDKEPDSERSQADKD